MKSNEALFIVRQNIIKQYRQYEYIIFPIIKFSVALMAIKMLSAVTGYNDVLNSLPVILFLALLTTFLPEKWITLGSVIITPLYVMNINPLLGAIVFGFLAVLYLVFMRLFPKESLLIIATLICFNLGIELFIPIIVALFGGYVSVIAIVIGIFIWFTIPQLMMTLQVGGASKEEIVKALSDITPSTLRAIIVDQQMLCTIVIFFIVFSIVYIIRKQSIDYAAYIAIGIGGMMNLAGFGLAILFLDLNIGMLYVVIMTIVTIVVAAVCEFFSKALDYQRAELVSFEDEENYYYVKVIPKIEVSTTHKKIKTVYNTKADSPDYMNDILNKSNNINE